MEKISINHLKKMYEIKSIRPLSSTIIQIIFATEKPNIWGDIHLYTRGGYEATILTGYETVYSEDGLTVCLSNDGSVYVEPEIHTESEVYTEPEIAEITE